MTNGIQDGYFSPVFMYCTSLATVNIGNNVESIPDFAFAVCDSLASIIIPNSVATVGKYAFYNCTGLAHIYVQRKEPPMAYDTITFYNVDKNLCVLHVPVGSRNKYDTAAAWREFNNIIEDTANQQAVENAKFIIENENENKIYITDQATANTEKDVIIWLVPVINNIIKSTGVVITATDIAISEFLAANAETQSNPLGVNGSFEFTVLLSKGAASLTTNALSGIITATKYVGIAEVDNYLSLRVYPNPTDGKLYLSTKGRIQYAPTTTTIELFDVVGMNVGAYRIRPTEEETVIDISHLSAGLYFLKVDNKVIKVVKE